MNRRGFLRLLGGMVGGIALDRAVPLGRVYSFPTEIKPLNLGPLVTIYYNKAALDALKRNVIFEEFDNERALPPAEGRRLRLVSYA